MKKTPFVFVLLPLASLLSFLGLETGSDNHVTSSIKPAAIAEEPVCSDCHSDLLESTYTHAPAARKCSICHQVDIVDHTKNGARGLHLSDSVPVLCFNCHDDIQSDIDTPDIHVHEALRTEGSCVSCHSPHASDEKKLLLTQQKKLCLSCHNKDTDNAGKQVLNVKSLLEKSRVVHPPVDKGCVVCHQPHASANNYLLAASFPKGIYASGNTDTYAICWECHDTDLLEAETTTSTNFRDGERNLHALHLKGDKGRSCIACHNVHASDNDRLIENTVRFGKWDMPINFKLTSTGGSCFPGCHGEKSYNNQ